MVDAADYRFSIYARGTIAKPVMVSLGGGTAIELVPAGNYTGWSRYSAVVTAGSTNEKVRLFVTNAGGELSDFFLDAAMLETGSAPASDYFTAYHSNLVLTIGDEDDDQIIFRSEGTATQDLVRIHQDHVYINGNLEVTGTTTTINTQDLLVSDNNIVLNKGVTGVPALDAFYTVERGTSTDAQIKWNESTDKWELYNHQSSAFETIVTSATGDTTVSLDAAYNGGSTVAVDDTNVVWTLGVGKAFTLADASDSSKFVVTGDSTASSVKVDTTGGVDIDADLGVDITGSTKITGATQIIGAMDFDGSIDHDGSSFDSIVSGAFGVTAGSVDVNSTAGVAIDAGAA